MPDTSGRPSIGSILQIDPAVRQSELHSVLFFLDREHAPHTRWTDARARKWLAEHNIKPIKPVDHKYPNQLRYRILDPRLFRTFFTKVIDRDRGIHMVFGVR